MLCVIVLSGGSRGNNLCADLWTAENSFLHGSSLLSKRDVRPSWVAALSYDSVGYAIERACYFMACCSICICWVLRLFKLTEPPSVQKGGIVHIQYRCTIGVTSACTNNPHFEPSLFVGLLAMVDMHTRVWV